MNQTNSREYGNLQSSNSSRMQSHTSSIKQNYPSSLSIPLNQFSLHYPSQPRDFTSGELNAFDLDQRDQQSQFISNRSKQESSSQKIIIAEKIKITSPSLKKRRKKLKMDTLVKKFIDKIQISNNKFTKNPFVNILLQDECQNNQGSYKQTIIEKIKKSTRFPLSRYSKFRQIWKVIMQTIYLTILIFSPFILVFPQNQSLQTLNLIQFLFNVVHSLLNLNTSYFRNDKEIKDAKQIRLNYLKRYAIIDILIHFSFFSIILFCESDKQYIVIAMIVLNLTVISRVKLSTLAFKQITYTIAQQILKGVYYCHLFTIIYISQSYETIIDDDINIQSNTYLLLFHKYLDSYIGVSDNLNHESNFEYILAVIAQLLFTFNKIKFLMDLLFYFNQNIDKYVFQKNYLNLKQYFSSLQVETKLMKMALNNYKFEMKNQDSAKRFIINSQSIKNINFDIQQNIQRIANAKYFKKINVLQKFSENIQSKLIDSMQFQTFEPNEIIIRQNCQDDDAIYLIRKGQVQICYLNSNNTQASVNYLNDMDVFGEISFFTGLPRTSSIVSVGPVQVFKIQRADFLKAIKTNRSDLEIASFIKDQILFNSFVGLVGLKCICCKSQEHLISQCDKLHYRPEKEKIISQHQFNYQQGRKRCKQSQQFQDRRTILRSKNSRIYAFQVAMVCEEFQENNFFDDQSEILKDLTQGQQYQSSTNIVQNQSSPLVFFPNRERGKSIEKNNALLTELDDIKEHIHDQEQMIYRKEKLGHLPSNNNFPIQEVIQEMEGEDQSSPSDNTIPAENQISNHIYMQNLKQSNLNILSVNCKEKYSDVMALNSNSLLQTQNQLSSTELKTARPKQKSFSYTPLYNQVLEGQKKNEIGKILSGISLHSNILEENERNTSESPQVQNRRRSKSPQQNQIKIEENNTMQFMALNSSKYFSSIQESDDFEKAQNYVHYYPYFNPDYLINLYNNFKMYRISKFSKKNSYTVSFVISERMKQKAI